MSDPDSGRLRAFIHHEATAGLLLVLAAAAAMVFSNAGGLSGYYGAFLHMKASVAIGPLGLEKPVHHWINDGLMAVFFFLVGLEIKREFVEGHLSSADRIVLPAAAALGGMIAPAAIFALVNAGDPQSLRGWAIPAATDIAFALGALSLAGSRVPLALKVFLLTLATLDDLGAIVVIALFYTAELSTLALTLAAAALAALLAMNRLHAGRAAPYILAGVFLWTCVLKSGVHATLAGVALGLLIPVSDRAGNPLVHRLEEALHPYVKFLILPLFAFANAGIPLEGLSPGSLLAPLPLGIALGLVVGKPLGIMAAVTLLVRLGFARLPDGTGWRDILGVACLAGIGFTMSLFIGSLAFADAALEAQVRLGVIAGSILATGLGLAILLLKRRV